MNQVDDRGYLSYQYSGAEKYLIRVETHRDYSETPGDFVDWSLDRLEPRAGQLVIDVGCGPGIYHRRLAQRGATVAGCDLFDGMLRERTNEAAASGRGVRATAEVLPFRDGAAPRVMANHMLYHVTDQAAALRELRRVCADGGRVMLTTNAADNMQRLHEIHTLACEDVGLQSTSEAAPSRFTLDDIELVNTAFPAARIEKRADALVFETVEPALRYYASFIIDYVTPLPDDGSHRALLMDAMAHRVDEIIARDGVLRIPKDAGCFVAEV